jgi:hypothetical protein
MRLLAGLSLWTLLLAGCAGPPAPAEADPLAVAPADLGIEVTIRRSGTVPVAAPVEARPGRFILFPDGSLHYGAEPEAGTIWRPGLARRLTREQVVELWTLARRTGLADPDNADPSRNLDPTPPRSLVYLAAFTAGDTHWNFVRQVPASAPPDPALRELIRALARLAWAPDQSDEHIITAPIRYDLGPDPYARFRWP